MSLPEVVVSGIGITSPIGQNEHDFFESLTQCRSGITLHEGDPLLGLPPTPVGRIPILDKSVEINRSMDRVSYLSMSAANQAIQSARLCTEGLGNRMGLVWGSAMGGVESLEDGYHSLLRENKKRLRALTIVLTMTNAPIYHMARRWGIRGPSLTISNACASSTMAIGEGMRWIQSGLVDIVLVGGAEAMLTPCVIRAWHALTVLAQADPEPAKSCRPFSKNRSGIVLSEGAAALILERADHAHARGVTPYAILNGYGTSMDASHLSRPDPDGQTIAMEYAFQSSGLSKDDVDYINAHGTGTDVGDLAESRSIRSVFGFRANQIPVSSTKSLHGHMMGAAGASEFIAALLAMRHNTIPPTAFLDQPDTTLGLDFVPNQARQANVNCVLSNSFAFGGANAVLIATRA